MASAAITVPFESVQEFLDPVLTEPPHGSKEIFSVERTWTVGLAETRYVPVVKGFLENYRGLGLSVEEAMFVIHLLQFKWNERAPFPGYSRIARMMGVSDKTVRRYAQGLERKGFLIRVGRKWKTNYFDLRPLFSALEQRIDLKKKARMILRNREELAKGNWVHRKEEQGGSANEL